MDRFAGPPRTADLPGVSREFTRAAHEKFYYFDVGVYRALRTAGPLDQPEEIEGISLEGLVAQHLRAWIAYRNRGERLYFWRTKSGSEADFVVHGNEASLQGKSSVRHQPILWISDH